MRRSFKLCVLLLALLLLFSGVQAFAYGGGRGAGQRGFCGRMQGRMNGCPQSACPRREACPVLPEANAGAANTCPYFESCPFSASCPRLSKENSGSFFGGPNGMQGGRRAFRRLHCPGSCLLPWNME